MKILVLSRNPRLYSTSRLIEAGVKRGHDMRVVDYLRCYVSIATGDPIVVFQQEVLSDYDAVIPRIGASYTFYGAAVVRQFQEAGTYTLNPAVGISRSRDKLRSTQLLAGEGLGLPLTGFAHATSDVDGLIDSVGGAPLVVKLLEGTHGRGVVLCETRDAAESVIEAFRQLDANFLVQQYVAEAAGRDIRALVVGDQVVAAMMRTAPEGEFRANIHRGATAQQIELTDDEASTAVRAAKLMGLEMAGVDLLRTAAGPMLLEVNSSPGLQGIEEATGINVAASIIEFLEHNARPGRRLSTD